MIISVQCRECGELQNYTGRVDSHGDLNIEAQPCTCLSGWVDKSALLTLRAELQQNQARFAERWANDMLSAEDGERYPRTDPATYRDLADEAQSIRERLQEVAGEHKP